MTLDGALLGNVLVIIGAALAVGLAGATGLGLPAAKHVERGVGMLAQQRVGTRKTGAERGGAAGREGQQPHG